MATTARTIDFLLDQLRAVKDVSARKMFGEYALYVGDKVIGLICDDQLFVKVTAPGTALVGKQYKEGFAYPGARASIVVAASFIEDDDRLVELVRITAAALPAPKPKKITPKAKVKSPKRGATRNKA